MSKKLELFLISLVALYFELVVIRWLSSEIRIFAYFKNIPLMACLFGMGLGMALGGSEKKIARWFPLGLFIIVTLICLAKSLNLVHVAFVNPLEHYLIGHFVENAGDVDSPMNRLRFFLPALGLLIGVFYLIVFSFACLGQTIGRLLNDFKPLAGYSINVLASLIGIMLFTLVSYLSLPPIMWLVVGFAFLIPLYRRPEHLVLMLASLLVTHFFSAENIRWSPYYRISVEKAVLPADGKFPAFEYGYNINVNYDTIEGAYNNSPEKIAGLSPKQKTATADYYDTPYLALGDKPRSILVLAAGTGNDVAAALRHGATEVDCVEIDPAIAALGKELHPENPYSDPRVHVIVDDARAYIRRTNKKYDLVVFAYLDSHSAFSAMSSLRLDNYVYTQDCFNDVKRLVKPDGAVSVTFYYLTWWQLARVYHSFEKGYGYPPLGVYSKANNGPTLLAGPGVNPEEVKNCGLKIFSVENFIKDQKVSMDEWKDVNPTTDDWPFLFLRGRGPSWNYAIGLIFTLYAGWWLVAKTFGNFSKDATGRTMFFLGAAFMLVETKSVTQMGLLAGTTWIVNSAVIAGVLLMILLANLLQERAKFKNLTPVYGLLFATLVFNLFFPISMLNSMGTVERMLLGSLVLVAPLFFAAIIFAVTFSRVKDPGKALGMNLLGTLIGGALEYLSMMIGISALNIIAALLYAMAFYYSGKIGAESETSVLAGAVPEAVAGPAVPSEPDAPPAPPAPDAPPATDAPPANEPG